MLEQLLLPILGKIVFWLIAKAAIELWDRCVVCDDRLPISWSGGCCPCCSDGLRWLFRMDKNAS